MELVIKNNYVDIDGRDDVYLDGRDYQQKRACQGICAALAMSPGTFIAFAGAAFNQKSNNIYYVCRSLRLWLIGAAAGVLATSRENSLYCIGQCSLNRGCDISGNPYPWDGFISATVIRIMQMIRKIHIIVCWMYIFLSFRAIINDTEYFLLIFLALIYSQQSLPLYIL